MVKGVPREHAQHARREADHDELEGVGARHRALRQAEHAHHGAVVEVALREAARRDRDRHGGQQGRQQRDEVEEFFGARQRLLHLGPPAFERFEAQAAHLGLGDLCLGPGHETLDGGVVPGHRDAVVQPARGLHQAGGRQVGGVDHHARREAHETRAPVGLDHDHLRQREARIPQQQRLPNLQVERGQQGRIDPDRARRRNVTRDPIGGFGRVRHPQGAAQRVTGRHRLQRHQPSRAAVFVARPAHGGKAQRLHGLQAQAARLLLECRRRRVVALDHRIATDQRPRVPRQPTLQPVGKKPHRRQRRHRQRHRQQQQPQFTRTPVAPKGTPAELPERRGSMVHGATLTHRVEPHPRRQQFPERSARNQSIASQRKQPDSKARSFRSARRKSPGCGGTGSAGPLASPLEGRSGYAKRTSDGGGLTSSRRSGRPRRPGRARCSRVRSTHGPPPGCRSARRGGRRGRS